MRKITIGLVALATSVVALVAPPAAMAAGTTSSAPAASHDFPSASSTVVGSTGFVDDDEVGYFWSAARGDKVEETFTDKKKVKKATLAVDVVYNGLAAGTEVDWTLSINGKDVGSFVVTPGQTGAITNNYKFKKIKGPKYDVEIRVTNEVPPGGGAITLGYGAAAPHTITLK